MGLMGGMGAVGRVVRAAQGAAEVFTPNRTLVERLAHEGRAAALEQLGDEFALARRGLFDRVVDGMNRLPRPMLALGTLGLFVYAMAEPVGFAARMQGLAYVPEPLWWLLGAIVGFYFGARELHYLRRPEPPAAPLPEPIVSGWLAADHPETAETQAPAGDDDGVPGESNAALRDWRAARR